MISIFFASEDIVEALQISYFRRASDVIDFINHRDEKDLCGITFEPEQVVFDGFPACDNPEQVEAWEELARTINETAIRQRHVRPVEMDETNEKYAFHTWLNRIGMNGSEYKRARRYLYQNLSGHTAFRTSVSAENWKQRRKVQTEKQRYSADRGNYAVEGFEVTKRETQTKNEGEYLKQQRIKKGLLQQQVADQVGIDISLYQQYESGERSIRFATFHFACQILEALGADIIDFFHVK